MARTSGGLVKTSFTVTPEQMQHIQQQARERGLSDSAVLRQMIDTARRVHEIRQRLNPADDLVIEVVAREEGDAA